MHVVVVGAGVVGTAQAWYLHRAGLTVTLIDRGEGPGQETSFANGGQISACHTQPWASPQAPWELLKSLGKSDAPLLVHPFRWDPALWRWGLHFLRNCTRAAFIANMERAIRPALYSRRLLKQLRAETGIEYRARSTGILKIYRSEASFTEGKAAMEAAKPWGLEQCVLTPDACVELEPALGDVVGKLAGGIFSPEDESGDAFQFTTALADLLRKRGVRILTARSVTGLVRDGKRITSVRTDDGDIKADAFVLAAGCESPRLAAPLGLSVPIVPVKGYSITLDVASAGPAAPVVSITDEEQRMVYSRLGNDLRAAGTAEFAGFDKTLSPVRVALIRSEAASLFPKAGDMDTARPWCGLRPTTPDNAPILGHAPGFENLFLNTGHGTLGWTQACGSARVVADLVAGQTPEISLDGLGLERFSF